MTTAPVWLFDLDNTLHDASHAIFPAINRQMGIYIQRHLDVDEAEAHALRQTYWHRYGATLLGLVKHHGTSPADFLAETHQLPELGAQLKYERRLRTLLRELPGRRIVFSNGPLTYATAVLRAMRLADAFDDVFAIERMGYQPKPRIGAFRSLLAAYRLHGRDCILVEDSAANLRPAKRLGMRTVWISRSSKKPPYVDLRLPDVTALARARHRLGPA